MEEAYNSKKLLSPTVVTTVAPSSTFPESSLRYNTRKGISSLRCFQSRHYNSCQSVEKYGEKRFNPIFLVSAAVSFCSGLVGMLTSVTEVLLFNSWTSLLKDVLQYSQSYFKGKIDVL